MNLTELGGKIQLAREENRMTQEQLAEAIGCSQSALSNYEKGKRRIYLSQLERLSEVLNRPLEYFVQSFGEAGAGAGEAADSNVIRLMNDIYSLSEHERGQTEDFIRYLIWKRRGRS